MTFRVFIYKSFVFFRLQNIAVILGTIISTAVLTGAFVVGDSVRNSLKKIVDERLGKTQFALQLRQSFIREKLGEDISKAAGINSASLLIAGGLAINPENDFRINRVQVIGIDSCFWKFSNKSLPSIHDDQCIVSSNAAERLKIKVGDEIILRVEKTGTLPVSSPYCISGSPYFTSRYRVSAIAGIGEMGRFSLKTEQLAPFNFFISRDFLAKNLDLDGLANTILFGSQSDHPITKTEIQNAINNNCRLRDAGLLYIRSPATGRARLVSDKIFIDAQISSVLESMRAQPVLTYLVNNIKLKDRSVPYSFVSAIQGSFYGKDINKGDIVINQWLADNLKAQTGDSIELEFFIFDSIQKLNKTTGRFAVREIIPVKNEFIDSTLMPEIPGFKNAGSCSGWNSNYPIDIKRIRPIDEDYWRMYRGTPKAYISLQTGRAIWYNSLGNCTSLLLDNIPSGKDSLGKYIMNKLCPEKLNFPVTGVLHEGILASGSGVDFSELFLSLGFFIILAGIILTIMFFLLGLESRRSEIGILMGLGFSKQQIVKIKISENLIPAITGVIAGVFAGIAYERMLLLGINHAWNDIAGSTRVSLCIKPVSLLFGGFGGLVISFATVFLAVRNFVKKAPTSLINEKKLRMNLPTKQHNRFINILTVLCFASSAILLIYSFTFQKEENSSLFLSSGGLFLSGCIALFYRVLNVKHVIVHKITSFSSLAFKNASRNIFGSITVISLLAIGVFIVMITGANRRTFSGYENNNQSGTGGFSLWVETSLPFAEDLTTKSGRHKLGLYDDMIPDNVKFAQFLSTTGDDASCRNINRVAKPPVLGLDPVIFQRRKSFSFDKLLENSDENDPWSELEKHHDEDIIPAFIDESVITWGLHKKVGDTLSYTNEKGKEIKFLIAGGLNESIFQGYILISEKNLKKNFPSAGGSKLFLVDAGKSTGKVREAILSRLKDYGVEITSTNDRLENFNAVSNAYLSVFMILGGIGILIGTIGIGIVLFKNLLDRRQEIAMMQSLGFSKPEILSLVFIENVFLIMTGMVIGLASSAIGILPSLVSDNYTLPGHFVFLLVALIFVNSLFWISLPVLWLMNQNLVKSLRNE